MTPTVLIIASLPSEVSVLTPIACALANASMTLARAPLCSATPTGPGTSGAGMASANAAALAWALRKPRQFGPSRVMPCPAACAARWSCSTLPSPPTSRYPEASTTAPRTPAAAASSSTPSTAGSGAMINARSTGSGKSRRLATASRPKTVLCTGCTGISGPSNPAVAALTKKNRAQPDVSDAPTTAMLRGAKKSLSLAGVTSWSAISMARRCSRAWPRRARFLGQAERSFADDVALDLAGPRVDGACPAGQEYVLPLRCRISAAVGTDQRVGADDVDRDLAEPLVVLAPDQLGDRGLGARRLALGCLGKRSQPVEPHDLDPGERPGQVLTGQRVGVLAVLARGLDELPELPLEAEVLYRDRAAALVPERGHRDLPAVVEAADHIEQRDPHVVDEVLAELAGAGNLPDRLVGHARIIEREQHIGKSCVLGRLRVAAAEREHHVRPCRPRRPHLRPGDHDLVAVHLGLGLHA